MNPTTHLLTASLAATINDKMNGAGLDVVTLAERAGLTFG